MRKLVVGRDSASRPCRATAATPSPRYSTTSRGTIGHAAGAPDGDPEERQGRGRRQDRVSGTSGRPRTENATTNDARYTASGMTHRSGCRDQVRRHLVRYRGQQPCGDRGEHDPPDPQRPPSVHRSPSPPSRLTRVRRVGRGPPTSSEPRGLDRGRERDQPQKDHHAERPELLAAARARCGARSAVGTRAARHERSAVAQRVQPVRVARIRAGSAPCRTRAYHVDTRGVVAVSANAAAPMSTIRTSHEAGDRRLARVDQGSGRPGSDERDREGHRQHADVEHGAGRSAGGASPTRCA